MMEIHKYNFMTGKYTRVRNFFVHPQNNKDYLFFDVDAIDLVKSTTCFRSSYYWCVPVFEART